MHKWVYSFGDGAAEGGAGMRNLLGGKGANLAEMSSLGLPVPPGFTISTEVCGYFYAHGKTLPDGLKEQVKAAMSRLERDLIVRALRQTQNNVTHAARLLKISRKGLQLKMKELGLRERDPE